MSLPKTYLQMYSTVSADAWLTLKLVEKDMPEPRSDQVVIRVEAAPVNPSDHGVMFGVTDMSRAKSSGSGKDRILTAPVSPQGMAFMKARVGQDLPVGNEGAGNVVAAGDADMAQAMLGKTVAGFGGKMYGQYAIIPAMSCLALKPGHSARDGASSFVNPMTALGFVETMKMEGHAALVHTAAASNLGQMLNRVCLADGIDIVNIVRKREQVHILKDLGARYIVNSSDEGFMDDLTDAIHETGATLGYDAVGGGSLASDILTAMESAAARTPSDYSIYGSTHHKHVYVYGALDFSPTVLARRYGMAWGVGGWLLPNFLARAGMETGMRMRGRVADELTSTFASSYTDEISLADALDTKIVQRYNARKTGEKFLICPQMEL